MLYLIPIIKDYILQANCLLSPNTSFTIKLKLMESFLETDSLKCFEFYRNFFFRFDIRHNTKLFYLLLYANCKNKDSFEIVLTCLSYRDQGRQVNSSFCSRYEIINRVPLGSALGLLLFSIDTNDLFLL